jgi:hypothetical protein
MEILNHHEFDACSHHRHQQLLSSVQHAGLQ